MKSITYSIQSTQQTNSNDFSFECSSDTEYLNTPKIEPDDKTISDSMDIVHGGRAYAGVKPADFNLNSLKLSYDMTTYENIRSNAFSNLYDEQNISNTYIAFFGVILLASISFVLFCYLTKSDCNPKQSKNSVKMVVFYLSVFVDDVDQKKLRKAVIELISIIQVNKQVLYNSVRCILK